MSFKPGFATLNSEKPVLPHGERLKFFQAEQQDIEQLVELINSAYRGESSKLGWTSEADILDGMRTDRQHIQNLFGIVESMILICKAEDELLGCLQLHRQGEQAQISMFAVKPLFQGRGIGKLLLKLAESEAQRLWLVKRMSMFVISVRDELVEFYLRRGYRCTGETTAFPENPALWIPKTQELQLELLEKTLE